VSFVAMSYPGITGTALIPDDTAVRAYWAAKGWTIGVTVAAPDPDMSIVSQNYFSTHAVAKGELLLNIKDYGAKCDGSTNDTAAWDNAIAAVNAAPASAAVHIYHPGGVSIVSKTSRLTAITKALAGIVGEPSGSAQIKFTNAAGGLDFGDGTNTVYVSMLSRLAIDGNSVCTLPVRMRKSEEAQWDLVRFQNTGGTHVELNATNLFFGKDLATSGGGVGFLLSGACGSLVFRGLNSYQATEVFRVSGSALTNFVLKDAWIEACPDLMTLNNSGNAISLGVVRVTDTYVLQTGAAQRLLKGVASTGVNSSRVMFRDCYVNAASSTTALVDFTAFDNSLATFNLSLRDLDLNMGSLSTHKLVEVHSAQSWFLFKVDLDNINGVTSDKWIAAPLVTGGTWPKPWRLFGSGTPLSAVTAPVGSIYYRSDGGTTTTLYVKESGAQTNTGWVAK
jgi:hypothetical protein